MSRYVPSRRIIRARKLKDGYCCCGCHGAYRFLVTLWVHKLLHRHPFCQSATERTCVHLSSGRHVTFSIYYAPKVTP